MTSSFSVNQALADYFGRYPDEKPGFDRLAPFMALGARLFDRDCLPYHWTASAWILDGARREALLLYHRKLQLWIQPGGHADGDPDLPSVALREAQEETGLTSLRLAGSDVFDFDVTPIPPHKTVPAHYHLDMRFVIYADRAEPIVESLESAGARWVTLGDIPVFSTDAGVARMASRSVAA
jgi:8-oxo-dGTP pyrophosphatase MutT (NUDIX family)